jgi:hypothetical protein
MAKRWEYMALRFNPTEQLIEQIWSLESVDEPWEVAPLIIKRLNVLGDDGWEVVGFTSFSDKWYSLLLKRPK